MKERLQSLQLLLERESVDCAVFGPTNNMLYLLGGTPHPDERLCILVVTPKHTEIIAPRLNADIIASFSDIPMIAWEDSQGPGAALSQSILGKGRIHTLAADGSMRADFILQVLNHCSPDTAVSADPVIAGLRVVKSPGEVAALADAAAQADRAMQAAVDACTPGATEAEVAWAVEQAFRRDGADRVEFTLIAAGANAAFPHHNTGDKVLQKGEGIIIDIGASLNGYKSDITRVVFLGEPNKEFLDAYELVERANRSGRDAALVGARAEDIDRCTRSVIEKAGMGEFFIHRTGHGLGLDIHEQPWIQAGNDVLIDEGMVFSIEPGVYVPDRFGIRIEDIVTVTSDGCRTLTGFDHSLIVK
jgi:Xaa-Pro aminopeptidase